MQKLLDGLRHFRENVIWERKELFERSVQGQKPQALLITCSDSRVLPEALMQADPGDLFVSRNPGNLVPPPDTPGGEAATIEYAVATLGVTDIIVCGHYRCGAVKALLDADGVPAAGMPPQHPPTTAATTPTTTVTATTDPLPRYRETTGPGRLPGPSRFLLVWGADGNSRLRAVQKA